MAKYIFLFCILLGVFLVSGFESVSGDMKEYKELRVTGLQQGKTECNISEAGAEQCRKVVYGGEYASKAIGNIATSVSRSNIPSSQVPGKSSCGFPYGMLLRSVLPLQASYLCHSRLQEISHTGNARMSHL